MLNMKPMSTSFQAVDTTRNVEVKQVSSTPPAVQPVVSFPQKQPVKMAQAPEKQTLWARIKKVKHIEIYAVAILVIVMVGIYISSFDFGGSSNPSGGVHQNNDDFARDMERQLERTLSQVNGAGRVSAMVTVVGSSTIEIAYTVEERTVTQAGPNGTSTTTTTIVRTPILTQNREPVVIVTTKPRIIGVVIVSQGANDAGVRMQLLRSVQSLIQDNSVRIEIVTGR